MPTAPDTSTLATTRRSLQAVAEHVLSAALHAANGHIGLRQTPGGFGTPIFTGPSGDRQIRVDGTDLVVADGGREARAPLTTLRAAADQAGIEAGAPAAVYTPATPLELDQPLEIDPDAARQLAAFYAAVNDALEQLRADHVDDAPAAVQLWPEHFDLATAIAEVNYGGSPGDATHPRPYLYIGPWAAPEPDGDFWNESFGASFSADDGLSAESALAFFRSGRARLAR